MYFNVIAAVTRPVKLKWNRWSGELRLTGILTVFIYIILLSYSFFYRRAPTQSVVIVVSPNDKNIDIKSLNGAEETKLYKIFKRADTTADNKLSLKELTWIIHRQVMKHIQDSLRNNFKNFFAMDTSNKNGLVEWSEYSENKFKGLDRSSRNVKELIAEAKAGWSEAARSNPDSLNIDEYLGFTHPESSHSILSQSSEESLRKYDEDGDDKISEKEFLNPFADEANNNPPNERQDLFRNVLDSNADGFADKREILMYLDPKSSHWSVEEAKKLHSELDVNQDSLIAWDELISKLDLVYKSKILNPEISLHDSSLHSSL
ncbi:SDF4 [Lepeophtheirus salmonis]|uniref:SDF4 n=1 Tax=Lepeophtheirus salmonis TaxID=72036 RepID=A0A0K2U9V1_LEPSM|nr:SDF4 [Lepeophtheirus salmonis]CAF3025524.1 SDF4 [Lepeophtheirus salmonis]